MGLRVEGKHAPVGVIRRINCNYILPVWMVGVGQPFVHEFINFPLCDINTDDSVA